MRVPNARRIFYASDGPTCGCRNWARKRLPVSGLFFTGSCATAARGPNTRIEMRRRRFLDAPSCLVLFRGSCAYCCQQ